MSLVVFVVFIPPCPLVVFGFEASIGKYNISYEKIISVAGGSGCNIRESITIKGWSKISLEGRVLKIRYDPEVRRRVLEVEYPSSEAPFFEVDPQLLDELEKGIPLREIDSLMNLFGNYTSKIVTPDGLSILSIFIEQEHDLAIFLPVAFPVVNTNGIDDPLFSLPEKIVVIRQLDLEKLRSPIEPRKEYELRSDCSNLYVVLYNLFLEENKIPDIILENVKLAFPDYEMGFGFTDQYKLYPRLRYRGIDLQPPCIPDGFHKFMAIATAVALKPYILIIDELENSLHPKLIEHVVDMLRENVPVTIATTHSPAVVDIVDPSELVISEMTEDGTVFRRIKDVEKVRSTLSKLGITLSEGWLWGRL